LNPRRESVEKRGEAIPTPNPRKPTKGVKPLSDNNARPPPALGPEVMAVIGRHLRAMYNDIIAEGVPERFAEILRRLSKNDPTPPTI
jgi:hypothetical protein